MADEKKLHPPQWLGRPILSNEHVQDLETRAAINEFHHKMPRGQAEQSAHDSYVKENRERAAAHHLAGMKAAMATGNHQDARKHWALYDLHLKSLGKDSIGAIPPEVEKRMMEEHGDKPLYRFKAHKGDLYALHEPSKDVAPAEGTPITKALRDPPRKETLPQQKVREAREDSDKADHVERHGVKPSGPETLVRPMKPSDHLGDGRMLPVVKEEMGVNRCKWRLGERRCQRMVKGSYCHSHVDHWANKIKQADHSGLEKAGMDAGKPPPTGTAHLAAPAQPQLHNSPEGFLGGLKAHPQGSPGRQQFIAQHINHAPLAQAFAAHPDPKVQALWKPIVQMGMKYANSTANAGFKPGQTKTMVKTEARASAIELLKGILELAKGTLIKFPGNPAPAVDQGAAAPVVGRVGGVGAEVAKPAAPAPKDPTDYSHLVPGGKLKLRVTPQEGGHLAELMDSKGLVLGSLHGKFTGQHNDLGTGFREPEIAWKDGVPPKYRSALPWMQMAIHQAYGTED